jgi:hypothetical protein
MNTFLIHRLRNAAIAADQRKDFNMAELLTEAINELEKITNACTADANCSIQCDDEVLDNLRDMGLL